MPEEVDQKTASRGGRIPLAGWCCQRPGVLRLRSAGASLRSGWQFFI